MLQTLVFNTKDKTVKVYLGSQPEGKIIYSYINVPTVQVKERYYEVMVRNDDNTSTIPVMRLPISNTNMIIEC